MRIGSCRGCGTRTMMARYAKPPHRKAPIEVEPSDDGNILVTGESYAILNPEERQRAKDRGFVLRKNHFATCKFARSFSNQERAKPLPANVVRFPNSNTKRMKRAQRPSS